LGCDLVIVLRGANLPITRMGGVEKLVIGQVVRRLSYTENRGIESREKPERNENSNPK
jgi:hypothetical protein